MSDEVTRTLASHGQRIAKLEGSVNELNTDLSKLHLTLEHIDDRASDRFATLNTSQVELKQILQTRDDEARAYRERREEFEREQEAARARWVQSLFTPNNLFIVAAIFLSMCGTRALELQELAEITNVPLPTVKNDTP